MDVFASSDKPEISLHGDCVKLAMFEKNSWKDISAVAKRNNKSKQGICQRVASLRDRLRRNGFKLIFVPADISLTKAFESLDCIMKQEYPEA